MALAFWYEFASTYSYLTAMRIEAESRSRGIDVDWRPFLLGPIFKRQGWNSSPFEVYPLKGIYMWRDMERQCDLYGLPLLRPDIFPQNSLLAARLAFSGREEGWAPAFTRAVYQAEFGEGRDISRPELLAGILMELGLDADTLLARAGSEDVKAALKAQGAEADRLGLFGSPSFVTSDGELFWGNDRLEQAFEWEARLG
ncbi:2-hydroxychromene-2-carboxylate isomerase [Breoghania corrubedonensis]|uniref:2-hydroxychromene-2-carboxylate isomerase n=1 Tax=Breoghania corrubedonensis TaxID=665038 RepID=A0A2T5VIB7_9HYPH|nr:2-hydroxychromene-2-carboxylate isomerase [Breoghania corrubedonensis]PTW63493.1 2-hydroxychromene-2-carboxylate isomerase [Breoghania corrubedonensis]